MKFSAFLTLLAAGSVSGFSANSPQTDRRAFVGGAAAFLGGALLKPDQSSAAIINYPAAAGGYKLGDPNSVVGREIRSFNSLIYNFKNTALDGGIDASTIKEPSISFIDFGEAMGKGDVTFVEFIAPFGEVAYATLKPTGEETTPKRIRIGQGYPTMAKNSWSSPDYVIRSVSNFGVPYKFTVPYLARYNKK